MSHALAFIILLLFRFEAIGVSDTLLTFLSIVTDANRAEAGAYGAGKCGWPQELQVRSCSPVTATSHRSLPLMNEGFRIFIDE